MVQKPILRERWFYPSLPFSVVSLVGLSLCTVIVFTADESLRTKHRLWVLFGGVDEVFLRMGFDRILLGSKLDQGLLALSIETIPLLLRGYIHEAVAVR